MIESREQVFLVVPFLNEAPHLTEVLASIAAQEIPSERMFLVAVDSGSIDEGPQIVLDFIASGAIKGVLLKSRVRSIPAALNTGFRWVGDRGIAVRLDAHTIYHSSYIPTIVNEFANRPDSVWCIGGAQIAEPADDFSRALVVAFMSNPIGLGFSPHRSGNKPRLAKDVYLGAFRPGAVARLGYFDERWRANEDSEVMARIVNAGGQILWVPLRSAYRVNRGAIATLKQWARYGFWRAQTIKRHPSTLGVRHLIPPLALVLGAVLILSPWRAALLPLIMAYEIAIVTLRRSSESIFVTAASTIYFPIAHTLNAMGLLLGFVATPPSMKRSLKTASVGREHQSPA